MVWWRAGERREASKDGTRRGAGSSRNDRFGHANATPLSDFNQVLNTSIVAHLECSHHHCGFRGLRTSFSLSLFLRLFLCSLYEVAVHWFGDCSLGDGVYMMPVGLENLACSLLGKGKSERKKILRLSPHWTTGAPRTSLRVTDSGN